jgi:RNA polymerase sigma factor (sigma-70 family)
VTDAEKNIVEKMVTKYIKKTVYGVRADYFRKIMKAYRNEECLDEITDSNELIISQSPAVCGHCGGCPNSSLCEALDELTDKQRFILKKIYVDGLAEHETAALLGISQQAVHFNKVRAIKKLRGILPDP